MRRYIWVPYFHSVALAPKETNFVSRIIGQFNKSVFLPLCQPCIQFCFYTSFLIGLNKCFSNFQRIYNIKNLKKICVLALQLCQKKKKNSCRYILAKYIPFYSSQIVAKFNNENRSQLQHFYF